MNVSDKPDRFVWSSYWRLAWSQQPAAKIVSPLRAVFAFAAAAAQLFYFASFHRFNEKLSIAVVVVAAYTTLYIIEAMWNFIFVAPVRLDETRRHRAKNDAVRIYCLKSELQEALERARPKIGFQLKSERPRCNPGGSDGQSLAEPPASSSLTLDLWNEGQSHVQVNTLRLENVSSRERRTVDVNAVLVPSLPPQTVDLTAELSAFLAGRPTNRSAAAGAHQIAISLQYEGGGTSAETEPKNYQVQVQSSEAAPRMIKVSREARN